MKVNSVSSSKQIQSLKSSSNKRVGKYFVLLRAQSEGSENINYLIIVTKKIGNAVVRNKIKRRLRYLLRSNAKHINPKNDYLFIAKKSITNCKFSELKNDFIEMVCR